MVATEGLLRGLAEIVGEDKVFTPTQARREYAADQWWYAIAAAAAGQPISVPDAAVRPANTGQVAAVVRLANQLRVPITPWGGGSGVQGAANADQGGIVIDLRGMQAVRSVDELSLTAVVEAGLSCRDFETAMNKRGLSFTHYPASTEWATIGGSISARGSGVLSTKYGKIEEHVLSVEWVTPTGEIVNTPSVPRHAAGPELTQLQIGAEGIFGIITAATVKLHGLPTARAFRVFAFDDLEAGIEAGRAIMTTGLKPPVMRLYDLPAASHSLARAVEVALDTPVMLMMFDGHYPELVELEADIAARVCAEEGGRVLPEAIGSTWWDRRYVFYYPPYAPELPSIWGTIDVVADFAHISAVYHETTRAIHAACPPEYNLSLTTHFSHWYEWGSMIYARMKVPTGPEKLEDAKALHDAIFKAGVEAAMNAGAVLNDHHGVGMRLAPYMVDQYGDAGMQTLARIKSALDPNHIMVPGKLGTGVKQGCNKLRTHARARKTAPFTCLRGVPAVTIARACRCFLQCHRSCRSHSRCRHPLIRTRLDRHNWNWWAAFPPSLRHPRNHSRCRRPLRFGRPNYRNRRRWVAFLPSPVTPVTIAAVATRFALAARTTVTGVGGLHLPSPRHPRNHSRCRHPLRFGRRNCHNQHRWVAFRPSPRHRCSHSRCRHPLRFGRRNCHNRHQSGARLPNIRPYHNHRAEYWMPAPAHFSTGAAQPSCQSRPAA